MTTAATPSGAIPLDPVAELGYPPEWANLGWVDDGRPRMPAGKRRWPWTCKGCDVRTSERACFVCGTNEEEARS